MGKLGSSAGLDEGSTVLFGDYLIEDVFAFVLARRRGLDEAFAELLGEGVVAPRLVDERAILVLVLIATARGEQSRLIARVEMSTPVTPDERRLGRALPRSGLGGLWFGCFSGLGLTRG